MNLSNLAESKGASSVTLILDRAHEQRSQYERMFKVLDAERMRSASVQKLIRKDLISKYLDIVFFRVEL